MQKLRIIGLFGCLIINNYAMDQNHPPKHLLQRPESPDFKEFQALSNLSIGYTPDWLDAGSLFVTEQADFSQEDATQRVVPADFKDTVSETQSPPKQSRFAAFFEQLERQRTEQLRKAFDEQPNTLADRTSATPSQLLESRFADFFRQNKQQGPVQTTIETAAVLLPSLNPQAQEFKPHAKRGGYNGPQGYQQGEQVDLSSGQQPPGLLHNRRRVDIKPLVLQPHLPLLPVPVLYPGLLPLAVVYQSLSRDERMEAMMTSYYREKAWSNGGKIHCCRSDCTQGGRFYSGHALIRHYEGLASYLQHNGLPIN